MNVRPSLWLLKFIYEKKRKTSKVNYSKLAIKMIKEIISMVNCLWSIKINLSGNSFSHLISLEKRVPFDSYMEL